MNLPQIDLLIVGAGPVGLMCAHLARLSGLRARVIDKSTGPLQVGRADALNARSLQLLELAGLLELLYPLGKPCNTSSIWSGGKFVSRQSSWWDNLTGCFHKHFLMLGQAHLEQALDLKLKEAGASVERSTGIESIDLVPDGCMTVLTNGERVFSKFVIGADGARSTVRERFQIPFEITRPELVWAVIDGVIETDFTKVPEIIVFHSETSDVAWIPREGQLDRFYVRMDKKDFGIDEVVTKINRALRPHTLSFKRVVWFSQFSVKESVAERFQVEDRVFLAGDACHIHSVNGGQGLNTGLADAFNLVWKLNRVARAQAPSSLLNSYEAERKPVAISVVETSAELVRATKFSESGTHAEDYLKIVERRAGHITGMGIRYGVEGAAGSRLHDLEVVENGVSKRLYSLLDYSKFTVLVFGEAPVPESDGAQVIRISVTENSSGLWTSDREYENQVVLVRPDSYIQSIRPIGLTSESRPTGLHAEVVSSA